VAEPRQDILDEVACYLAGAIPEQEAAAMNERFSQGWAEGEAALQLLEPGLLALADSIPSVQPAASLKVDLLAMLPVRKSEAEVKTKEDRGILFRSGKQAKFLPTPYPGISLRMLHLNRDDKKFTALMKMEPGARYPSHHHDGDEECLVLEGSLMVGDHLMEAGDYQYCSAESDHVDQWTETGALLYVTAPLSLLQ
jgi:quercetin dioxygenase-like cupin family protein